MSQRFLEVDDMDSVAGPINILLHFGIPARGLVTKVHPSLQ